MWNHYIKIFFFFFFFLFLILFIGLETLLKEKENYMKLSVQELKTRLKQKRKKVCGKKEVLVERLIMSNLDEINTKIKNELLYKLNIIQPEPKPKPEKNIPTHSKASSTGKIKYNKMPILVSTTTTTTTTTPKLTTPKLATTTTTATATTTIAAKTATITGTSTASTVGINTTPIIKPHLSIPKVNSVSLSKSLATLASKISSRSAKSTTVTNSNFINIPTQLSSLSSAVPTETTSFINQAVSKVNPANELEINNAINKSSFPTLPEEEEEDTFVASRTLPIADVLKNIRGSESTSIHSITEQYYRLKRKFEYQEILKAQHHLHHPISQIHPILKKLKYN
ncbi:hypothetical protein BCR36DRAFT_167314 [Piromyces finnis]|uniref:SAP domain-containing protein n=1 Tax=Piromyces finnis TaxID=1754191 RepID=A0A1Y1UVY8_9FUNG|nr:hypothetical protein BCR36DRAFT_167314 [Piromyces finnis]|eukprot:ORX42104.1 hypothetical protein BCR36DRAFT_167314 [Piromyces finnis]